MSDSTIVVLKGIYQRLTGYTPLTDLVQTRIYTYIPQQEELSYVRFGITGIPDNTWKENRIQHTLTVQSFSLNHQEVINIRQAVYDALQRQQTNIPLDSGSIASIQMISPFDLFQENDGTTWQAISTYQIFVNP